MEEEEEVATEAPPTQEAQMESSEPAPARRPSLRFSRKSRTSRKSRGSRMSTGEEEEDDEVDIEAVRFDSTGYIITY